MSTFEKRIEELGITLPEPATPLANYVPVVRTGNLIYLSGLAPTPKADGSSYIGRLGENMSIEEGYEAARATGINIVARLKAYLGDLDRVVQIVKLLSMVNSTPDFSDHPAVANGCSDLMVEIFGDVGRHARSAVGLTALPGGIPVEIELIAEIKN